MDWEIFGQRIAGVGKDVSERVRETADVVRLRQKLAEEERKLQDAYAALGKLFYEKQDGEIEEEFIPYIENITEAKAAAEEYRSNINQLKNQVECPQCGAVMGKEAAFCSQCGSKMHV